MRAYAYKAKDRMLVWWAAELKLDAERKAGWMLAEMGLSPGRPKKTSQDARISDYGINAVAACDHVSGNWHHQAAKRKVAASDHF